MSDKVFQEDREKMKQAMETSEKIARKMKGSPGRPVGTTKADHIMRMSEEQWERFSEACSKEVKERKKTKGKRNFSYPYNKAVRNRFMFALAYSGAMRVAELANLKLEHIDQESDEIRILSLKKGINRPILFGKQETPKLFKYYRQWMKERKKLRGSEENPFVFMSRQSGPDKPMSLINMQKEFKRVASEAGLKTKGWNSFSIHSIRHTRAFHVYQETKNSLRIRRLLGHQSLDSTEKYLERLTSEEEVKEMRQAAKSSEKRI